MELLLAGARRWQCLEMTGRNLRICGGTPRGSGRAVPHRDGVGGQVQGSPLRVSTRRCDLGHATPYIVHYYILHGMHVRESVPSQQQSLQTASRVP